MKILLIHHNTNNTGDDAIVESTIDQMREIFPDSEIVLESSNPEVSKKQFSDIKVVERLFSIRGINHTGKTLSLAFFTISVLLCICIPSKAGIAHEATGFGTEAPLSFLDISNKHILQLPAIVNFS